MVSALAAVGVETLLATTDADGPGRLSVETGRTLEHEGARTIFFPRLPGESLKASPALSRWLRSNTASFDLVHVHSVFSHPSLAAGTAARSSNVPCIVRPLGQLDAWSLSQHAFRKQLFLAAGGRRLVDGAAAMHWTDASERDNAPGFASNRPGFVVPLGVDEGLFGRQSGAERRKVVLFLSRLHAKKNVEGLVEAFLGVRPALDGWKLLIAGEGDAEYTARLKALVARIGGVGRIEFAGWLAGEAKRHALQEAALLALPSRQENFGIAVAEAMAAGTPVLVSDAVALAAEVEASGAGWVARLQGDGLRMALAEAMGSDEERRRRGAAARRVAEEHFRWPVVAESLAREYDVLLRHGRGRN
jgi:glycosyltransferase involved in cell wall biosynthesis